MGIHVNYITAYTFKLLPTCLHSRQERQILLLAATPPPPIYAQVLASPHARVRDRALVPKEYPFLLHPESIASRPWMACSHIALAR